MDGWNCGVGGRLVTSDHREFLRDYTQALRDDAAALFVGAGVSRASGYVDWKQLLRDIAEDLGLDVDKETDLVAVAQYHVNKRQGRDRLNQLLVNEFLEQATLTPVHEQIAALPVRSVWTTNYDDLLERAFEAAEKRCDVKRRATDFATTRRRSDVTVYKMHGDKTEPSDAVLCKEDYETYNHRREIFSIALKGDLSQKTFLFIGFSFSDPNVAHVLSRVRQLLDRNSRKHYCIVRSPENDPNGAAGYEGRRFAHWLADLSRYNIQPVVIHDYSEIPKLLAELNRRSHLRDVFVSGSAVDFAPLGEDGFRRLCRLLGKALIDSGFNVVSGYGLGVGDDVIVGAMQALNRNDDERLQLWPFPQAVPSGTDRATLWSAYRRRMLSGAGVCLVLSGNKIVDGAVVPASGVREEVEIAKAQGKIILPIGATGYVAHELWETVTKTPSEFFGSADISSSLRVLGDSNQSPEAIAEAVVKALKVLERN